MSPPHKFIRKIIKRSGPRQGSTKKVRYLGLAVIVGDEPGMSAFIIVVRSQNAFRKKIEDIKIVTSGAGAAGIAIIKLLISMGLKNVMTDRKGAIYEGREGLNPIKEEMAKITNANHEKGSF